MMTAEDAKRLVDQHIAQGRQIQADLEAEVTRLEVLLPKLRRELERARAVSGEAWQEGEAR